MRSWTESYLILSIRASEAMPDASLRMEDCLRPWGMIQAEKKTCKLAAVCRSWLDEDSPIAIVFIVPFFMLDAI